MFDKLKKMFGASDSPKGVSHLDNENWRTMRASNKGAEVIKLIMTMHIKAMEQSFPEWKGLFDITIDNDNNVVVHCNKGFNDTVTKQAIPCTWQRKSFIENCRLVGVKKIVYLDMVANTFDLLEVDKVDATKLP